MESHHGTQGEIAMLVMMFVTDDGTEDGTGPVLFMGEWPDTALPPNPRGYEWRYFATVDLNDQMFGSERELV
ncbi:MAG TPA: hypothetical protein VFE52_09425, partial [Devosia sp.]|nr:hypothetical protein [Devosia sp.]